MPKQKVGHQELATYRTQLALKTKLIYFSTPYLGLSEVPQETKIKIRTKAS